jgi:hypothetical protein
VVRIKNARKRKKQESQEDIWASVKNLVTKEVQGFIKKL